MRSIWLGYEPRESEAFAVCRHSLLRHSRNVPIQAVALDELRDAGLYRRPTSMRDGRMWDDISGAPCSTEFAISRFLVPHLAERGWALFMDCDILALANVEGLFALADDRYAVMCVQHPNYKPPSSIKMDGQLQTLYARKNWSSVMLFNVGHPANAALTVDMINTLPGRDLHRFCWLQDREIGDLPLSWNWLVGTSDPEIAPDLVHFTNGGPWFEGHGDVPFAAEWRAERRLWLRGRTQRSVITADGAHASAAGQAA